MSDYGNPFGVRYEKLLALPPGHVIDAIPTDERDRYMLRGASVGMLAINLANGIGLVNFGRDPYMHVAIPAFEGDSAPYQYAASHAAALAIFGTPLHFSAEHRIELSTIVGTKVDSAAGIVFGLEPDKFKLATHPVSGKLVIAQEVGFSDIDPYSQAALSEIFEVDVASLPPHAAFLEG